MKGFTADVKKAKRPDRPIHNTSGAERDRTSDARFRKQSPYKMALQAGSLIYLPLRDSV